MKNKNFKKITTFSLFIFTLTLLFHPTVKVSAKTSTGTTSVVTSAKPIFGSTFIQYWYSEDWSKDRWLNELKMLQNIGINEIILQTVADTKSLYAAYYTSLNGYTHNVEEDMLENVLVAADQLPGMKVRIGLGSNSDWWNKKASDVSWLNSEAEKNKAIFNEILQKYGNHQSLAGWYISYEFSQLTATTSTTKANLNNFLKQICNEIKLKDTRNIMIAPFYNSKYSLFYSLSGWTSTLQTVLKDTKIDIVALQDSIGVGYNTLSQLTNVFSYTKKATDSLGISLYADTETFTTTSNGNVPAAQSRISSQLSSEKNYVKGFVAFSIDHFQNNNVDSQVKNYNDYYNYYQSNK